MDQTDDPEVLKSLVSALARLQARDERILSLLLEHLHEDVEMGAANLAAYGDPQAIPHLQKAFDKYEPVEADRPLANQTLIELHAAIEELGGELTEVQLEKYHRVIAAEERFRRRFASLLEGEEQVQEKKKLGRNELCWCGSGKKYKKCHWAADREQHR